MRIAFIGPESCGKSTLSAAVAGRLDMPCVPEYARTYVERLTRPYLYRDVVAIAHRQIQQLRAFPHAVFDTELIITQVWMHRCYGRSPWWLQRAIEQFPVDYYFLCAPDLPWQSDPVRENPGCRDELFRIYLSRVRRTGAPYAVIRGTDPSIRLQQVLRSLSGLLPFAVEEDRQGGKHYLQVQQ